MKTLTTGLFLAGLAATIGVSVAQTTDGGWRIKTPPIPAMDIIIQTGDKPQPSDSEEQSQVYQSLSDREIVFAEGATYQDVSGEAYTERNYNMIALEGQKIVVSPLSGEVESNVFTPEGILLKEDESLPMTGKYQIQVRAASPYQVRIKVD